MATSTISRFESLPAMPFYVGLVLCGLATCLLGPILPALSARWSLSDTEAGWLFASQFAASTVGAVISSYAPRRSVVLGFAAIGAGLALLAEGDYGAALPAFALIGIGLGCAVAATNLIFGTEYPERRGSLLTWVNLCWGAGAVLAPELVALAVGERGLRSLLLALAGCVFLLFASFTWLLRRSNGVPHHGPEDRPRSERVNPRVFALFSVVLFLYVGTETAIAGWIATYAHRLGGFSLERASLLVGAFWIALVAGRGLVVALLRVFPEQAVLLGGLALAIAGVLALLFPHGPAFTLLEVVAAGLGCAPVFPLLVARMLARTGRTRHVGWIFAICGSGGAVVPWLTGAVSQHSGGIRIAFLVPLASLAVILACVIPGADAALLPSTKQF